MKLETVSCFISLSKNWTKYIWSFANTMYLKYYNTMARDFVLKQLKVIQTQLLYEWWEQIRSDSFHSRSSKELSTVVEDFALIHLTGIATVKKFFFFKNVEKLNRTWSPKEANQLLFSKLHCRTCKKHS